MNIETNTVRLSTDRQSPRQPAPSSPAIRRHPNQHAARAAYPPYRSLPAAGLPARSVLGPPAGAAIPVCSDRRFSAGPDRSTDHPYATFNRSLPRPSAPAATGRPAGTATRNRRRVWWVGGAAVCLVVIVTALSSNDSAADPAETVDPTGSNHVTVVVPSLLHSSSDGAESHHRSLFGHHHRW